MPNRQATGAAHERACVRLRDYNDLALMDENDDLNKQRLLDALAESDKTNSAVEGLAQTYLDSSRLQLDLNVKIKGAVEQMGDSSLPPTVWGQLTDGIVAQNVAADIARRQMGELQFFTLGTTSNVSTASVTATAFIVNRPPADLASFPAVLELQKSVQAVFDGRDSVAELVDLISRLGINVAHPGSRSPLDHLQQASLTLRRPPGPSTSPTAVFMDVREGVDTLLDRLAKRTCVQKRLKGVAEKIAFIGENVGYLVLGRAHFERLGSNFELLREAFTDAKGASMSREEVLAKFNEAMFVLVQIVKGVDPSRLR